MSSTHELSADAKEFVPASYSQSAEMAPHKLSADAKEFVPSSSRPAVVPTPSSTLSANAKEFVPSSVHAEKGVEVEGASSSCSVLISHTVSSLVSSPEEFFEIAFPLIDEVKNLVQADPEFLHAVTDKLVEQSINVSNCQYIGARLCAFLYQHLPQDLAEEFRTSLLNRCKLEFDRKQQLSEKVEDHWIIVSFTLFMGELMSQMTKTSGETFKLFLPRVFELLSCLLSIGSDETVRGFTHTLKLTGAILDKLDKQKVDEIFTKMKMKIADEKTTQRHRALLLTIIQLRAERWHTGESGDQAPGKTEDTHVVPSEGELGVASGDATAADNEQVYYDSSEEELMDRCNEDDFEVIDDGENQYVVPRDMDAEMEAAFERFMLDTSDNLSGSRR